MSQVTQVRMRLLRRVAENGGNVAKLARELGINKTTLWRFLWDNYEPETKTIRRALGLENKGLWSGLNKSPIWERLRTGQMNF